jgi:hypothetical protein
MKYRLRYSRLLAAAAGMMLAFAGTQGGLASPVTYIVTMSGAQVVPPAASGLSGLAQLTFETADNSLNFNVLVIGAAPSTVVAAELRQGAVGTNGPLILKLADGGWVQTAGKLKLSDDQAALLVSGQLYLQVQGTSGPLIRGQVLSPALPGAVPTVPAPPVVPPPPPPAPPPAPASSAGAPAATSAIRPPATGDGGLH